MINNGAERYKEQRVKEKILLCTISGYSAAMMVMSVILHWPDYLNPLFFVTMVISWFLVLQKYRDFKFRMNTLVLLFLLEFMLYGIRTETFYEMLIPLAAITVVIGLTALPEMMWLVYLVTAILCLIHAVVLKTIPFHSASDRCNAVMGIGSIMIVEIAMYRLIRKQQKMLQQRQKIIDELRIAENSKADFLANVSHEIRTPINAVCGMSEIILMEELEPKVRENVVDIQIAGRNLLRIVSDILDFTELHSQKMEVVEEPYNITSLVNDVMNRAYAQIDSKKIEFIIDCDTQIPRSILGDEQKIFRVVTNILSNAIKFTTEGCIRLSISFRQEAYGINLIIGVKDTGVGIKKEDLEKLFVHFSQVDAKKSRQEGGIGLGLAISKALIQKMNGFIKIDSEWGEGTEVQFVIPQKVLDQQPIMEIEDVREKHVITYIDMEKFKYGLVRDSYDNMLRHLSEQQRMVCFQCRNLAELKRRLEKGNYSHIFIGWEEYCEDRAYFDKLAEKKIVAVAVEKSNEEEYRKETENSQILFMRKPFYALSVISILNETVSFEDTVEAGRKIRFTAPEASVLVVDDSLINQKVVEGLLRPYQLRVFTAESGKEALSKIEKYHYDFIFMDHMMPEMDGVETLHKIRQQPGKYFQEVPVIALTANAVGGARQKFLQEGFQDFIAKPIEMSVLEHVLMKYIPVEKRKNCEQVQAARQADTRMPEKLVQVQLGVEYAGGSMEDYKEIVQIFCSAGRDKMKEIKQYYEQQDWDNYSILVHALKSTSLSIGATTLSELAKEIEMAAKEMRITFIREHHEAMVEQFYRVVEELETRI